eukprot:3897302-Prymnesium_polylepis.1
MAAAAAAFAAEAPGCARPGQDGGHVSRSGRRARRACCVWQHPAALALREAADAHMQMPRADCSSARTDAVAPPRSAAPASVTWKS